MAQHPTPLRLQIETLSLQAVRKGRELGERLACLPDLPIDAAQAVDAARQRLQTGGIADARDLAALDDLRLGLEAAVLSETIGMRGEPRLTGYDEHGEIWDTAMVPRRTPRGEELASTGGCIETYLALRRQLLDLALAERLAGSLLR